MEDGIRGDYENAYREYWRAHSSDQMPPLTELAIIGTQTNGILPIHDRWCLTGNSGIRIGTSFNSLGVSKTTEISELNASEVAERRAEAEQYLERRKREHLGEKLTFNFVSL